MDGRQFDDLTRKLATGTSRRALLRGFLVGTAAIATAAVLDGCARRQERPSSTAHRDLLQCMSVTAPEDTQTKVDVHFALEVRGTPCVPHGAFTDLPRGASRIRRHVHCS